jgi:lysophospholipase L1-like esterase
MASICVFGDSIGEGYYDSKKGGWVSQLSRFQIRKDTRNYLKR